jgi:hypothetical protein
MGQGDESEKGQKMEVKVSSHPTSATEGQIVLVLDPLTPLSH